MGDTLEIFGQEYTDVTGFKAKNDLGNTLIYTKGSGGIDIPVMTVTVQASGAFQTISCNKTYNECYTLHRNGVLCSARVSSYTFDPTNIVVFPMYFDEDVIDGAYALLFFNSDNLEHSIVYKSNGTLVEYDLSDW